MTSKLKKQSLVTQKPGESDGVEEDPKEQRERERVTRAREYDSVIKDYDHSPEKHEDGDNDLYGYGEEYDYKYKRDDRDRYIDSAAYYQGQERYSRYSRYEERGDPREERYAPTRPIQPSSKYGRYEPAPEVQSYYRPERGRTRGARVANDRFDPQGFDEYGYYNASATGRGRARGRARARGQEVYRDPRDYDEYGGFKDPKKFPPTKYAPTRYEADDYYKREDSNDDYPASKYGSR